MMGISTRATRIVAAGIAVAVLSGCYWSQPGFDSGGSGFNKDESAITSANVSSLAETWTTTVDNGSADAIVQSSSGSFHVADDAAVYAIDPATGARQWRTPVVGLAGVETHPAGRDDLVVPTIDPAASPTGQTVRLDAGTGAVVESLPGAGATTPGTEVLRTARHRDWVVTTYLSSWVDFTCVCWIGESSFRVTNLADPSLSWGMPDDSASSRQVGMLTNPVIIGDRFYVGQGIYSWDGSSSTPRPASANLAGWDLAEPCISPCTPDFLVAHPDQPISPDISASPDRSAVAIGAGEALHVVDLATATTAWTTDARFSYVPPTWTPEGVFRLISYPEDALVAYPVGGCAGSCTPSWTTTLAGEPVGQASAAGDLLFVGTADGTVAAYPSTCTDGCPPAWSVNLGSAITAPPIVTQGRVIVGTADGRVVAFGLPG